MSDEYTRAGVNIDAGNEAVRLMKDAIRRTYTPQVLSDTGNFGGLYALDEVVKLKRPILVASTDGVGTKTKVAARMNRWDTVGQDLVNHCINDILVQGAKPLFFMDYVATAKLNPQQIADVVKGIALACEQNNIALLGGETAEMPGVYQDGEIDIAGTIVGVVEHGKLIDGKRIEVGDVILNLPSSGLHTNGFSLARKILDPLDWESVHPKLGMSIGDALLKVHQPYLQEILHMQYDGADIRGLAHITGGGVVENLPRILPTGVSAQMQVGTWDMPAIFNLIQELGNVDSLEMYRVFNMGLGMLIVVKPEDVTHILNTIDEVTRVGDIVAGDGSVQLKGLA
jgi:phosphoribosylformylglycinamidine cyclo-ligase